jgi:hypothetical protein
MAGKKIEELSLEDVRIGFRNFEGKEGKYNRAGERSFSVFLEDHSLAEELYNEGWNVKFPKDRDDRVDPDEPAYDPHMSVAVSFDRYPPQVILISNGNPTRLSEQELAMLDWAEIETVDLILRPYTWEVRGQTGIKAYLKKAYITIVQDKFAEKYGL